MSNTESERSPQLYAKVVDRADLPKPTDKPPADDTDIDVDIDNDLLNALEIDQTPDRRVARAVALQSLFEADAAAHEPATVIARRLHQTVLPTKVVEFSRALVTGVADHKAEIDSIIATAAPSWPLAQMAKIDKSILRLAIFEILFDNDVPVKAAINEAIELAKHYGSDSSGRFVNGVLGTVVTQKNPRKGGE